MQIAEVVGHATATVKHPSMAGWRLLVMQLLTMDGGPDGEPILGIDTTGAAVGDRVIVTNDGLHARELTKSKNTPVRWSVLGIWDE